MLSVRIYIWMYYRMNRPIRWVESTNLYPAISCTGMVSRIGGPAMMNMFTFCDKFFTDF